MIASRRLAALEVARAERVKMVVVVESVVEAAAAGMGAEAEALA